MSTSDSPPNSNILARKTVLVACSALKAEHLVSRLREWGAEVLLFEAIQVRELADQSALARAAAELEDYAWIIFTSAHGVIYFSRYLESLRLSEDRPRLQNICAIGPSTAKTLQDRGFTAQLIPKDFVAEGVIRAFEEQPGGLDALRGKKILLPCAKEARDLIPRILSGAGAIVNAIPCYETVTGEPDAATLTYLNERVPHLLVFTSSSNVVNFTKILGMNRAKKILGNSRVAVLGPVTGQTVESFGKKADILPAGNTIEELLKAIYRFYRDRIP